LIRMLKVFDGIDSEALAAREYGAVTKSAACGQARAAKLPTLLFRRGNFEND
jgi:hypothetical protein